MSKRLDLRIISTVFVKELREAFRDRRTTIIMVVLPLLLMPAVVIGMPMLMYEKQKAVVAQPSEIVVLGYEDTVDEEGKWSALSELLVPYGITIENSEDEAEFLLDMLAGQYPGEIQNETLRIIYDHFSMLNVLLSNDTVRTQAFQAWFETLEQAERSARANGTTINQSVSSDDIEKLMEDFVISHASRDSLSYQVDRVRQGLVHAVIVIPADILESEAERSYVNVTVYFDQTNSKSLLAYQRVSAYIGTFYTYFLQIEVMNAEGMEPAQMSFVLYPSAFWPEDIPTESERGAYFLSFFLPMILGIYVVSGSMYTTIDITAGEKERHTMEALLVTPPKRINLVLGKFLTIITMTLLIIMIAMFSMVFSLNLGSATIDTLQNISFNLTPAMLGIVILIFFVLAVMVNALEMALCFMAKSFKEAQNYVTPLTFAVLIPAIMLQGFAVEDLSLWYFAIPIFNVLAVFQEVLLGTINLTHLGVVVGTSGLYAVASCIISLRVFEREDILFRS